jgi:hypothetical protein
MCGSEKVSKWLDPKKNSKQGLSDSESSAGAWHHLRDTYLQRLLDESVPTASAWPYSFGKAADGRDISPSMRRKFLNHCRENRGRLLETNIFSNPELFCDPPSKHVTTAARIFCGALLRAFGLKKRGLGS